MARTSHLGTVYTKQQRLAHLARQSPQMGFTSLAYLMDLEWLQAAYRRLRKEAAVGVDGLTAAEYERDLEANLRSLLQRAQAGTYRAPPVRRAYIRKGGSRTETRPIGIPTLEDKLLQRAVVMLLEPIYEQDFLACSFGFRPRRSAHQALEALWRWLMSRRGGWVVEVDIRRFFDTLDHGHLRTVLAKRVRDGVLRRLIGKWLKAGVLEGGRVTVPEMGTAQGSVLSPLLANVYLHAVLDEWFEQEVKPGLQGQAVLIRYCDDFVLSFTHEGDARRLLAALSGRFQKYGLALHPAKTRLLSFHQPPPAAPGKGKTVGLPPQTFQLLGFTHYWGRSRQGNWVVKRKTASERLSRAIRRMAQWCRLHRHQPLREQQHVLSQKLRGHCAYYGITGNAAALSGFRLAVLRTWRRWLTRRNRQRSLDWPTFTRLLKRYPLPPVRVVHSVYAPAANP